MKSKRLKFAEEQKEFDARSHKRHAYIKWFTNESAWSPSSYHLPEEYSAFFYSFQTTIQEALNNIDISKENGDCLDAVIDSAAHIALRELKLMQIRHLHSLMEIETTKKAHLFQLKEMISLLEKEIEELTSENEEVKS